MSFVNRYESKLIQPHRVNSSVLPGHSDIFAVVIQHEGAAAVQQDHVGKAVAFECVPRLTSGNQVFGGGLPRQIIDKIRAVHCEHPMPCSIEG